MLAAYLACETRDLRKWRIWKYVTITTNDKYKAGTLIDSSIGRKIINKFRLSRYLDILLINSKHYKLKR